MTGLWYIWIAVIIVALIVESQTTQLVSIWFVPGALFGILFDLVGMSKPWQITLFVVISFAGIVLSKTLLARFKHPRDTKTNLDAVIGSKCVVTEKIDNYAGCGQAKVGSQLWSARGVNENDTYEAGEVLEVVAIEGVKLICRPIQK